jgi:hypothetical protein
MDPQSLQHLLMVRKRELDTLEDQIKRLKRTRARVFAEIVDLTLALDRRRRLANPLGQRLPFSSDGGV